MAKFKAGDIVTWTNEYGVKFPERKVIGVEEVAGKEPRYFIEPHDAHWMSIRESQLIADADDPVADVVCGQKIRSVLIDGEEWFWIGPRFVAFPSLEIARQRAQEYATKGQAG